MAFKQRLRTIWYSLSANQRHAVRRLYYWPSDTWDGLFGRRNNLVPPRGMIYTGATQGPKHFLAQGQHQLSLLKDYLGLKSTDTVLDIGSGIGRTAIALTDALDEQGAYEGFDVVELGVDWCKKKITRAFPNFRFTFVPLFNDLYNTAEAKAEDFVFPYPDDHFDVVFSFSVFTHMQVDEIHHYLKETRRVLKPGGRCLSTFFVYDENNEAYISNNDRFSFPFLHDGYRLMSENVTAGNICLQRDNLFDMMKDSGFSDVKLVEGFWKDEQRDPDKREYQDMLIYS